MSLRYMGLLAWATAGLGLLGFAATAQVGVNGDANEPQLAPAPDWVVWQAFYEGLKVNAPQSPGDAIYVVADRIGLAMTETNALIQAGQDYLQQLTEIDEAMRRELAPLFHPDGLPPISLDSLSPSNAPPPGFQLPRAAEQALHAQRGMIVARSPAVEGIAARYSEQRRAAFASHKAHVAQILGPERLAVLEQLIADDVAPHIRTIQ